MGATERGYSRTLAKSVLREESAFRGEPIEHGLIIDKDGNVLSRNVGTSHEVQIKGSWKDNIITHNHPSGRSFSKTDIVNAVYSDAREMRAVGRNGFTYSMKRPEKGWGMTGDMAKAAYAHEYLKVKRSFDKYVAEQRKRGNWWDAQGRVDRIIHHVTARNLAKEWGWEYSKSKTK